MNKLIIYDKFDTNWKSPVAILHNAYNVKVTEKLNSDYHLNFNVPLDSKSEYVVEENYIECEDEVFVIKDITKDRNSDNSVVLSVRCEHVFYAMLDDYVEEANSYFNTPMQIIEKVNLHTNFNIGGDSLLSKYPQEHCTISRGSPIKTINRVLEKWDLELYRNRRSVNIRPFLNIDKVQLFKHEKNIQTLRRVKNSNSVATRLFLIGREGVQYALDTEYTN